MIYPLSTSASKRIILTVFLLFPPGSYAEDVIALNEATAFQDTATVPSDETTPDINALDTLEKQASYAFGVNIATRIKSNDIIFDAEALSQGVTDGLVGNDLRLSPDILTQAYSDFIAKAEATKLEQQNLKMKEKIDSNQLFLTENGQKEDVVTTESGLQYKIIRPGTGTRPDEEDTVVTHYRGTLLDGREFDSSYKRNKPAIFPVKGVIKGWVEALQLMKVGAKWKLFIPSELAYGDRKRSELVDANELLVFDIELLEIKK